MCWANGASQGSSKLASTTSSNGHTARWGSHGSESGSVPAASARAPFTTDPGNGKSMLAQMPSWRPGVAPRWAESRCVSQRSMPRVGTETTSGAMGSSSGLGHQVSQHRRRARRPARIGGRAAPRQSTSAVFSGDRTGQPPCWGGRARPTPCRCWRRPRAAPRWSAARTRRRAARADRSADAAAPSRSGRARRSRRTACPRRRGRGTCGR